MRQRVRVLSNTRHYLPRARSAGSVRPDPVEVLESPNSPNRLRCTEDGAGRAIDWLEEEAVERVEDGGQEPYVPGVVAGGLGERRAGSLMRTLSADARGRRGARQKARGGSARADAGRRAGNDPVHRHPGAEGEAH